MAFHRVGVVKVIDATGQEAFYFAGGGVSLSEHPTIDRCRRRRVLGCYPAFRGHCVDWQLTMRGSESSSGRASPVRVVVLV